MFWALLLAPNVMHGKLKQWLTTLSYMLYGSTLNVLVTYVHFLSAVELYMYIRYICTFHMCMQHGIGNATTAIQGFPSLLITSTRVTCFSVHNASVLPMHGFDLAKHVNHNEGGWTDEPLGQDRLLRPHCPQLGSCKLVRCIEFKNVFLRTTRP